MLIEQRDRDAVGKMKQFATYFTHGVRHGAQLRASIYHAQEAAAILELVDEFFHAGAGAGSVNPVKKVQLITDGACLGNPGPGGWAAMLRVQRHRRRRCGAPSRTPPTTAWS